MEKEIEIEIINNYSVYCFEGVTKNLFQDEFENLKKNIRATYLSYAYYDTKTNKAAVFFSNEEWQYQMVNNKLIYDCPLYKLGFKLLSDPKNTAFSTFWNHVKPTNKKELFISGARNELNIANGFSFSQQHFGIKECIGLAGDVKDTEFYTQFILNPDIVTSLFKLIRKILINSKNDTFKRAQDKVSSGKYSLH